MMYSRYGRVYKPRGIFSKAAKFVGVTLLVLITLFFYLYFTWQKYIVYTDNGVYLDLPFRNDGSAGQNKPAVSTPVADSLTGEDDAAEDGTEDTADVPSEGASAEDDAQTGDAAADGTGDSAADTALPGDAPADGDTAAEGDGTADLPEDGEEGTAGDDAADTALPAVPGPGDTAGEEDDKPKDNGVKDSFI